MSAAPSFWDRRRTAVAAEDQAEQAALVAQAEAERQAVLEQATDEELLANFDLPVPETMVAGDDFSAFMAKAIPERIRRRALRTLWRSNPVLACVDNLVDYGEDYTCATRATGDMKTTYQVGKGLLRHIEEMARQAEASEMTPVVDAVEEDLEPEPETIMMREDVSNQEIPGTEPEDDPRPMPRRMAFRIEDSA